MYLADLFDLQSPIIREGRSRGQELRYLVQLRTMPCEGGGGDQCVSAGTRLRPDVEVLHHTAQHFDCAQRKEGKTHRIAPSSADWITQVDSRRGQVRELASGSDRPETQPRWTARCQLDCVSELGGRQVGLISVYAITGVDRNQS